jgi:hypothetical protein
MEERAERADSRIPVSRQTWETLHGMRKPGQTYDELILELISAKQSFVDLETAKKMLRLDK